MNKIILTKIDRSITKITSIDSSHWLIARLNMIKQNVESCETHFKDNLEFNKMVNITLIEEYCNEAKYTDSYNVDIHKTLCNLLLITKKS